MEESNLSCLKQGGAASTAPRRRTVLDTVIPYHRINAIWRTCMKPGAWRRMK